MMLEIKYIPPVALIWDGDHSRTIVKGHEVELKNGFYAYCDLEIIVEGRTDDGDRYTPPSFEVLFEDIQVGEIAIFDEDGNEVTISAKQEDKLANQIKENLNYD